MDTTAMDDQALSCHIMLHDKSIFPDIASLKDDTCYICLESCSNSPEGETAVKLPCGHVFGLTCIANWTRGKEFVEDCTCPMCRQPYGTDSDQRLISWLICYQPIHYMMQGFFGAEERAFGSKTLDELTAAIEGLLTLIEEQGNRRTIFATTGVDREEMVEAVKGNLELMHGWCKRSDDGLDNIRSMVGQQMIAYEGVLVGLGVGELLEEQHKVGMSKAELLQDWW